MIVVVDANELFGAIIARSTTLNLFFDKRLEIVSPKFILKEFREHKSEIIERSGLSEREVSSFLILLSPKIKFFDTEQFEEFLEEAKETSPDSDDIEYFALALKLNSPLWSEDKALKKQSKVTVYNTSELLKHLGLKQ
jgi:predicted nucleic acid-binding protein